MIHKIKAATIHFFVGLLIVLAISLTLVRFFLWGVDDYKIELENKIYQLTDIPLKIDTLRANMRGFSPEIVLKNIHVLTIDTNNNHPIKLQELRLGVNLMDLLLTQQLLPSSWITLVGVKLSVVRKEDGSISIVGLNTSGSEQPFWLLEGGQYEVLKSEITWLDKQRNAAPIKFDNVDLLIKNKIDSQQHEIHLVSQLPEDLGESLRVSMSFHGNVFEKDNINGLVYIKGDDIQLAKVLTGEQPLGQKVTAGKGDFELWTLWEKSQNTALTGNIQAKDISIQKQQESLIVDELQTHFTGFNQPLGWQLGVKDFIAKTADKTWPTASFNLSANEELTQFSTSLELIDLQELVELVQFFAPLDEQKKKLISSLALKGQLKDFSAYIDISKNTYAVNGSFENIFVSAFADFPQIENFTGSVQGSNESGDIGLKTEQSSLFFAEIFRKPLLINELTGQLSWQQQADSWLIKSEHLVLNVKDAQSENKLRVIIPKNDEPVFMDLQSSFYQLDDVSTIPDYYPVSIMEKNVLNWLDNAFVSGKIEQGGLLVYGELNQFPFINGQGVFEVLLDATDVELKFAPDWPHLNKVNAEILFQKESLTVTANHAEVDGMNITHTIVKIPSFEKSNYLLVEGHAKGGLATGLNFLQKTPLHNTVDAFLEQITPSGILDLEMGFKVPFIDSLETKVNGVVHLKGSTLNVKAIDLKVSKVKGDLRFTEKGLFSKKIAAKTLGYPIEIQVDNKGFNTAIRATGKTNFSQLQKQFSFLNSKVMAKDSVKGAINYQVLLELPMHENNSATLNIKTNLAGVTVDLPGLLKKNAQEDKQLNLSLSLNNDELLPLTLNYSDDIKLAMNIDKQQNAVHSAHIVYGNGQVQMPKQKGINIQVEQDTFDMTEWTGLLGGANAQQTSGQLLNEFSLVTKDLHWKKKQYGAFKIAMKRFDQQWQGNLACPMARGAFVIPVDRKGNDKIKLEMAYLKFPELMQIDFQSSEISTQSFPLIDVFSEEFWWNGANLGSLKIATERTASGVKFKHIEVLAKAHKIEMTADWVKQETDSVTNFQGTLLADDMGALLSQVGIVNDLKEAKADIKYSGQWPKSPYQFSLATVDAEVSLQLKDGRIASIEPGLGRLLGLVAMEQWIKRLTLNFGDLFKKGLSFNAINGTFQLEQGKAHTTDLRVDAVPAQITINGETDLLTKTLDYSVSVVPKSAGAVPIAGTIVSRIAGTITQVVTNDYKKGYFFGSKYQVTGKWGDIKVKALHDQDGLFKKTWTTITSFPWAAPAVE